MAISTLGRVEHTGAPRTTEKCKIIQQPFLDIILYNSMSIAYIKLLMSPLYWLTLDSIFTNSPSLANMLSERYLYSFVCLFWGLTTCKPLWVSLCHFPEKRRRDSRGDEREGHGRKRKMNESEETDKTLPPLPTCCCKSSRPYPTVRKKNKKKKTKQKKKQLDALMRQDTRHL